MSVERENPYLGYRFRVHITAGFGGEIHGGFQEVSGLGVVLEVAEYREGTDPVSAVRKLPGMWRVQDVVLRRGLTGRLDLWEWVNRAREGHADARATVKIELMSEDAQEVVLSCLLRNALPIRWEISPLRAEESELLIEELILTSEGLDVE